MGDVSDHVIPDLSGQVFQVLRPFFLIICRNENYFLWEPDYLLLNGMPGAE